MSTATETRDEKIKRLESIANQPPAETQHTIRGRREQLVNHNTKSLTLSLLAHAGHDARIDPTANERAGNLSGAAICRAALQLAGLPTSNLDDQGAIRSALSSGTGVADIFTTSVTCAVIAGFAEAKDTSAGLTLSVPLSNFRTEQALILNDENVLEWVPRGTSAPSATVDVTSASWSLARYGKQLVAAEEDLVDGAKTGAIIRAARQLGAAAARLKNDLFASLLLANPALDYDSVLLFHADHSNLGTPALDAAALSGGLQAIAEQTRTAVDGSPVHLGLVGQILIVPPALAGTASQLAHSFNTGVADTDIEVRVESRIGAGGVVGPTTDQLRTGSDTAWYLAAKSQNHAGVIFGYLDGIEAPAVRSFALDRGEWGLGWDVKLDIAAKAAAHESWYKSSGAA